MGATLIQVVVRLKISLVVHHTVGFFGSLKHLCERNSDVAAACLPLFIADGRQAGRQPAASQPASQSGSRKISQMDFLKVS